MFGEWREKEKAQENAKKMREKKEKNIKQNENGEHRGRKREERHC